MKKETGQTQTDQQYQKVDRQLFYLKNQKNIPIQSEENQLEMEQYSNLQQSLHIRVQQDCLGNDSSKSNQNSLQLQGTRSRINIFVVESKDISLWHPKPHQEPSKQDTAYKNFQQMSLVCIDLYSQQQPTERREIDLSLTKEKLKISPQNLVQNIQIFDKTIPNLTSPKQNSQNIEKENKVLVQEIEEKKEFLVNDLGENDQSAAQKIKKSILKKYEQQVPNIASIEQKVGYKQTRFIEQKKRDSTKIMQYLELGQIKQQPQKSSISIMENNQQQLIPLEVEKNIKKVHFHIDFKENHQKQQNVLITELGLEQRENTDKIINDYQSPPVRTPKSQQIIKSSFEQNNEFQQKKIISKVNNQVKNNNNDLSSIQSKVILFQNTINQNSLLQNIQLVPQQNCDSIIQKLTEKLKKLKLHYRQLLQQSKDQNMKLNSNASQIVQKNESYNNNQQKWQKRESLEQLMPQINRETIQQKKLIEGTKKLMERAGDEISILDSNFRTFKFFNQKDSQPTNKTQNTNKNLKLIKIYDFNVIISNNDSQQKDQQLSIIKNIHSLPKIDSLNNVKANQFSQTPIQKQPNINDKIGKFNSENQSEPIFHQFYPQNVEKQMITEILFKKNSQQQTIPQIQKLQNIAADLNLSPKSQKSSQDALKSPSSKKLLSQHSSNSSKNSVTKHEYREPSNLNLNLMNVNVNELGIQKDNQLITVSIIRNSIKNLTILKESIETLSYQRIKTIMKLTPSIIDKISFKQKHYPSQLSTEKQLKLYGKRLFKSLIDQSHLSKQLVDRLQDRIQYQRNSQYVAYFLKQNTSFILICYYNKTIYIGPYLIQSLSKQIVRQGHAVQYRQNKYIYQGEFFADKKHGYGYMQFLSGKDGKIYCGNWMDGFMDGQGQQVTYSDETYEGDFKLGCRDGIGQLHYDQSKSYGYQGQFYDGYKHGKGYERFQNGDSYSGSFLKDKFNGQGQYKWKNHTIYTGTFHSGQKHGQGLLLLNNGKQFEKYYDHNREINLTNNLDQKDKNTVQSSRLSTITQTKHEQKKSLTHEKPKTFKNYRSVSGKSLFSADSLSKEKSLKNLQSKKNIAQIMKQKQLQQDLKNLDIILKSPSQQNTKKIFSIKKLDPNLNSMGKMYNFTARQAIKINQNNGLDLLKLGKMGQGKSLINFNSEDRLQQLKDSSSKRRGYQMTNFSQF